MRSKRSHNQQKGKWKLLLALMASLVLAKLLLHERPAPEMFETFPTFPTSVRSADQLAVY